MRIPYYCFLLALFISALACSESSRKKPTQDAANDIAASSEATAAELGGDFSCDGEGTELSGVYDFSLDAGEANCADNQEKISVLSSHKNFSCVQNKSDFKCTPEDSSETLTGCVSKQGQFKLSADSDLGYLSSQIATYGAEKEDKKATMVGTLGKSDGKARYSELASRGDKKKGCVLNWDLEVTKIEDLSDTEEETTPPKEEEPMEDTAKGAPSPKESKDPSKVKSCVEYVKGLDGTWKTMNFNYETWIDDTTGKPLSNKDLDTKNMAPLTWYRYKGVDIEVDSEQKTLNYKGTFSDQAFEAKTSIVAEDSGKCILWQKHDEQTVSNSVPEGDVEFELDTKVDLSADKLEIPVQRKISSFKVTAKGRVTLEK